VDRDDLIGVLERPVVGGEEGAMGGCDVLGSCGAAFIRAKNSACVRSPSAKVSSPMVTESGTTAMSCSAACSAVRSAVESVTTANAGTREPLETIVPP